MVVQTLIAIVGLPASGKSTAIDAIKQFGPIIVMGDIIREEVMKRSLEPSPENIGKIANELRAKFGKDIIAKKCVDKIHELHYPTVFIDGIRSGEEVRVFREIWKLYVIAITCPNEIRFKRIMQRGRSDDASDMQTIRERDLRELSFGLGDVIEHADYSIENNVEIERFQLKVKNLVQGLL
jgi:dephospho-CoA kinase